MNAIDTNVLVYSVDASEPTKGAIARELLAKLAGGETVLLWQVLCEFSAVLEKLRRTGRARVDPVEVTAAVMKMFPLAIPDRSVQKAAVELCGAHGVSFWDALLISACAHAGVTVLYTEDIQSARILSGVRITNPFAAL